MMLWQGVMQAFQMDVRNDSCTNFIHPLGGDGEHVLHALQVVSSLLTVAFWFVNVFCRRSARLRNLCIHPNLKVGVEVSFICGHIIILERA